MKRSMRTIRAGLAGLLAAVMVAAVPVQAENTENSKELLPGTVVFKELTPVNADFETASEGPEAQSPASGWAVTAYHQDGRSVLSMDNEVFHSGKSSLKMTNTQENDVRVMQVIPVEEDTLYVAEVFVKTEGVGPDRIGANISVKDIPFTPEDLRGTTEGWQQIRTYIKTEKNVKQVELTIGLGGYGSANTGTVWIDDLTLKSVDRMPLEIPFITLKNPEEQQQIREAAATKEEQASSAYTVTIVIMVLLGAGIYYLTRSKPSTGDSPLDQVAFEGDLSPETGSGSGKKDKGQAPARSKEADILQTGHPETEQRSKPNSVFYEEER